MKKTQRNKKLKQALCAISMCEQRAIVGGSCIKGRYPSNAFGLSTNESEL